MDKLPKADRKKIINKAEFKKLAARVKKTLEQEVNFLDKIKSNENCNSSRPIFCN